MVAENCEQWLSDFWDNANKSGLKTPLYLVRHPRLTSQAIRCLFKLPRLRASLSDSPEGSVLKKSLKRVCLARTFQLGMSGACVLSIPSNPSDYSLGSSKQTLRRKVRSAIKLGVICSSVTDIVQQRHLCHMLDKAEKFKSNAKYQNQDADSSGLVNFGLWTAAFDQSGTPLVVAITPFDGEFALLQKFVSLGETPQHSDARYMLHQFVIEQLAMRKVKYLFDTRSPAELPNGLRHYQRMLGFRIKRIQISRAPNAQPPLHKARTMRLISKALQAVKCVIE